jgi:4a-hydroxytetrahydrobiopterin dehydratase
MPLADRRCVPCSGSTPTLDGPAVADLLAELDGWAVEEADGHEQLAKRFSFRDFVEAVDFVNRITPVAEAEGHHPDLAVTWGAVRVQLWMHAAGGLTENDFILAAKIDRARAPLAQAPRPPRGRAGDPGTGAAAG